MPEPQKIPPGNISGKVSGHQAYPTWFPVQAFPWLACHFIVRRTWVAEHMFGDMASALA
jgi:hypothetical protein